MSVQLNGHGNTLTAAISRLLPQHLTDLRKSGLSDEQITACGFTSYQTSETVQKVLRWKRYKGELGPCLAIPFFDAEGKPVGYDRLKPDRPRAAKEDGKLIRYESPKGSTNLPYLPPFTRSALQDASTPLVITGGRKEDRESGSGAVRLHRACGGVWLAKEAGQGQGRQAARRA